ncbi:MAG: prepilin-type N-terminal cleavage/methylation domain-containing protein [Trichocoleus desertorum ATA4-8-CV12]|jgi:prepilin-type N-terminal cleavage/methylation domain-containing protein|nr:prepilin-type N-terminal cleavage/methylation domain-containing protein [Trichocoleus desertorum ATA4-8-CV12]
MQNFKLSKTLSRFSGGAATRKNALHGLGRSSQAANSGFTLLELLVVVIIIAALAAITAPGWLTFVNRQKVSKAQDRIFSALQDAQTTAKKRKLTYQVSFRRTTAGVAQYAVHPSSVLAANLDANAWKNLSPEESGRNKAGQLWVGTNISSSGINKSGTPGALASGSYASVVFDYFGTLPIGSDTGLDITIALPQGNNSAQSIQGTKRCVKVTSLLGAMTTDRASGCS